MNEALTGALKTGLDGAAKRTDCYQSSSLQG